MKKFTLSFNKSLLLIAVLSLILVIAQSIIQNGIDLAVYWFQICNPIITALNFLPIFVIMTLIFCITNSVWKSFFITSLPVMLLLIINYYKSYFLDAPLVLADIIQAFEALSIVQNYTLTFSLKIFLICILLFAVLVFLILRIKSGKKTKEQSITTILILTLISTLSYYFVYSNQYIYDNVAIPVNPFYDVGIVNSKGLLYSLISKTELDVTYNAPEGYSKEIAENILNTYTISNEHTSTPNVIAIMSEAFFDPQNAENIDFYKNPLTNYNTLKKEAYYGNIIVPGFAGSTASTEFEFLTGMNVYSIDSAMPNIYKTHITQPIYSIVDLFKSLNYSTLAIHPGDSWFYNRKNVYNDLGFDTSIFKSDLPKDTPKTNYYINDSVTSKLIIENYEKHLKTNPDKNYFNFTVTIQNHGPYMDYETKRPAILKRPDNISDELYNVLNNYMLGLSDADKLLGDIASYINTLEEPTVLVFFGDHLPFFDSELLGYEAIGYDINSKNLEGLKRKYTTPFLIWGNDAFRNKNTLKGYAGDISSNYLANKLLEYINVSSPFFEFTKMLENKINIIAPNYFEVNSKLVTEIDEEKTDLLKQYRILEYYNLKEKSAS